MAALTSNAAAAILQPIQLGAIKLPNRVGMSALTRNRAYPGNVPNDVMVEYYRQRAAGGAGLIITEGVLVTQSGYAFTNVIHHLETRSDRANV
jgi:2,4-dienoyl-CoA reductase-like NADH-dependent reductase (Old Yellow Enzyme family)